MLRVKKIALDFLVYGFVDEFSFSLTLGVFVSVSFVKSKVFDEYLCCVALYLSVIRADLFFYLFKRQKVKCTDTCCLWDWRPRTRLFAEALVLWDRNCEWNTFLTKIIRNVFQVSRNSTEPVLDHRTSLACEIYVVETGDPHFDFIHFLF